MALLNVVVPFLPGSYGSNDGVPASTRTAPVLTSSATTAPLRPCERVHGDLLGLRVERRLEVVADPVLGHERVDERARAPPCGPTSWSL